LVRTAYAFLDGGCHIFHYRSDMPDVPRFKELLPTSDARSGHGWNTA